jgi:hypothetical protein
MNKLVKTFMILAMLVVVLVRGDEIASETKLQAIPEAKVAELGNENANAKVEDEGLRFLQVYQQTEGSPCNRLLQCDIINYPCLTCAVGWDVCIYNCDKPNCWTYERC